jgi:hypothetical protein
MGCRKDYVYYIQSAYDRESDQLDAEIEKWKLQFNPNDALFGYSPPGWPLPLAAVTAFLYELNADRKMAESTRDILLQFREWAKIMPEEIAKTRPEYADGVNPIEPVFQPLIFIPAAERIKPAISRQDYSLLEGIVADSVRKILFFPEWGGHNRAMLRAAGLAMAGYAFPDHPEASMWNSLADELAEESWGRWSIEDAQMYQSHWLRAMILYSEARGKKEIASFIQPRMVLKSMVQLMTPLGSLPDYGDSHWLMHSQWEWMACLEWGAKVYQDETMKWAANRIWEQRMVDKPTLYGANVLTYAWRWCDDGLGMKEPTGPNEALDDLVLKKSVFRTGLDKNATYGLFNYRDEGPYGRISRDYLRTTLAVSAEKMHHGHGDEGSFSILIHKGTVLLHESGYRESPPDGIYRSNIYHNRLVWRNGERPVGKSLVSYLRGNGFYKPMQTERLYQTHLGDAEITRLRIQDVSNAISWDRTIFFLPKLPCWVVVDSVLEADPELRLYSSMWWTKQILKQGENWMETFVDRFVDWENPKNAALLIAFPQAVGKMYTLEVEKSRRSYQEETAIENTWYGKSNLGEPINFVTVLWPHDYTDLNPDRVKGIHVSESEPKGRGVAVTIDWEGESRKMTLLNDLTVGWLKEEIRPRYKAENAMTAFGDLSSDAAFTYTRTQAGKGMTGFINGTRLVYQDRILYQALESGMFQEDATHLPGIPARFRWEGQLE